MSIQFLKKVWVWYHLLSQKTHVTVEQYLSSSMCRRYVRDTFVPSLKYNGPDYNHFKGLAIQHKDCKDCAEDDAKPWLDHVRNIICNGDKQSYEWVMNFLAAPLQASQMTGELPSCFTVLQTPRASGQLCTCG